MPGAASWNRPVSIGFTTMASRSRSISEELAALGDPGHDLPDERRELRRGAANRQGTGGLGPADRTAAERGIERFGDDGEVRKFGHGCRL